MFLPIREPNGRTYHTLICDACRKPIKENEFNAAIVDFFPITSANVASADYDTLLNHAATRHFHVACAGAHCTRTHWAKAHRVMYALVANVFNAKGSTVGKAAQIIRKEQLRTDPPSIG